MQSGRRLVCSLGPAFFWLLVGLGGCSRVDAGSPEADAAAAVPREEPTKPNHPSTPRAPATLRDVLGAIDFASIQAPKEAERASRTSTSFSFSQPKVGSETVSRAIKLLEEGLSAAGFEPAEQAGGAYVGEAGAIAFYEKQGIVVQLAVGVSRGSREGSEDVNAGLFLLGDVDSRSLPRPPGEKVESEDFSSSIYQVAVPRLEVRELLAEKFEGAGWTPYRQRWLEGVERTQEQLESEQAFLRGPISADLILQKVGSQTRVIARVRLLTGGLPVMPGARMLEYDGDLPYVFHGSLSTLEEVRDYYLNAMQAEGWRHRLERAESEKIALRVVFEAEGRKPLLMECLVSSRAGTDRQTVSVQISPWKETAARLAE